MPKGRKRHARIILETARWRLGTLWFVGSGAIFLLLAIQTLTGVYEERAEAVWGWALPNFFPVLMTMVGVFAGAALADETEADRVSVRANFFKLATGLSAFHLLCVLLTLLVRPLLPGLSDSADVNSMEVFEKSSLFLSATQGLVGAAIGALFFTKAHEPGGAPQP